MEKRDLHYLLAGIIIGGGLGFLGSYSAAAFFILRPDCAGIIFWASFPCFLLIFALVYIWHLKTR